MHNIVIFGDSITQGAFDGEFGGWVSRLAAHCYNRVKNSNQEATHIVFNLGISGDTSKGVRARFEHELALRIQDAEKITVLIDIGGNDALVEVATGSHWVEVDQFIENVSWCIGHAKEKGCAVVVIGMGSSDESRTNPLPWDSQYALRNVDCDRYDSALKALAASEGVLYIPMNDVITDMQLLPDGDHPGAEGHRLMFERVKEYLEKAGVI